MAGGYGRGHRRTQAETPCSKALMHRQSNGVIAHHSPLSPPTTLKNGSRVLTHNLPSPPGPWADELVTGFIFLSSATHREAEATPLKERAILPGAQMEKKKEIVRVTRHYLFARQSRDALLLLVRRDRDASVP